MESARRASAIHEKRTGRALRITEADVINEEMFEEINDLPSEYRRLNAHLQTQSVTFDRRLLAYLSSQIGTRQALSDCWQNEQPHCDTRGMSPNMMQQPPPHMPLAHVPTGIGANYRQTPYPTMPQGMHPGQHARPASAATSHATGVIQQQLQSPYASPHNTRRQMSLPINSAMQPPWPNHSISADSWNQDNVKRTDSAIDMSSSPQYFQQPTLGRLSDPEPHYQQWQTSNEDVSKPLSVTLPLNSQDFFFDTPQLTNVHDLHSPTNSPPHDFTDRRYSYNPNGRPKPASNSPARHHCTIPSGAVAHSSSPSPLRLDTDHYSKPSPGAFSQVCHEASGMGPSGTFTRNALKETSDAMRSETSPVGSRGG